LPAYLLAGAWQWVRGRDVYWDNPFEVEARRIGCVEGRVVRRLDDGLLALKHYFATIAELALKRAWVSELYSGMGVLTTTQGL